MATRAIKTISFSLVILVLLVFLVEFIARVAIGVYSRDKASFLYGIDDTVRVRSQNRVIRFYRVEAGPNKTAGTSGKRESNAEGLFRIAAFGGSTTQGFNCSKGASSWPAELERILNSRYGGKVEVLNFGADGTNSDYAVEHLPLANAGRKLDLVLWANYVNESDILFTGPGRNIETLNARFPDILGGQRGSRARYGFTLFMHRLDKTIEKYSLLYWGLKKSAQMVRVKFPRKVDSKSIVDEWRDKNITDRMIALALENYRINYLNAKEYCKKMQIQMIIVRLPLAPLDHDQLSRNINISFGYSFFSELQKLMSQISIASGAPFINVQEFYDQNNVPKEVFCDGAHQTLKGHRLTAQFIAECLQEQFFRSRKIDLNITK